jgi:hypothetical protein
MVVLQMAWNQTRAFLSSVSSNVSGKQTQPELSSPLSNALSAHTVDMGRLNACDTHSDTQSIFR